MADTERMWVTDEVIAQIRMLALLNLHESHVSKQGQEN